MLHSDSDVELISSVMNLETEKIERRSLRLVILKDNLRNIQKEDME